MKSIPMTPGDFHRSAKEELHMLSWDEANVKGKSISTKAAVIKTKPIAEHVSHASVDHNLVEDSLSNWVK